LEVLEKYLHSATSKEAATAAEIDTADAQYHKWIQSGSAKPSIAPTPDGIAFIPEYKNWKAKHRAV